MGVAVQFRLGSILGNDQVQPAVAVKVADRGAALFAIYLQAALLARNRVKTACTIAFEQQPSAGIIAWRFRLRVKKVLCQKKILVAVSVKVSDADAKDRRHLRFNGQR